MDAWINYEPPAQDIWQGRDDSPSHGRFFHHVDLVNIQQLNGLLPRQSAIIGFASDEGIRRNLGRCGAKSGPDVLRRQLAKLPYHGLHNFSDLGTIVCNDDLEFAQLQLANLVKLAQKQQCLTIVLGGGHELAWGHFQGLADAHSSLGIINIDAHFDLRMPLKPNFGTSGTAFQQIYQYCQENRRPFQYCCIGIQPQANIPELYLQAKQTGTGFLSAEQINNTALKEQLIFLENFVAQNDHIYLSICLDVFTESTAPGVSAPQALGLLPWQIMPLLKYIQQTGKVVALDIAELSPPLDSEHKTARLAATILATLLDNN